MDYLALSEIFFSNHHTAIAILDRYFNFLRVNELYAKADNRSVNDFLGKNHFDLYPNDENKSIFEQVVQKKETYQVFAKPFVYPDNPERGTTYWDWTLVPVLDEAGEVEILIFTLVNVTEQKRKEIELELFFELSHDLLCVVDYDSCFKRVNQAFESLLGYSKDEIVGTKVHDYVHPEDIHLLSIENNTRLNDNITLVNYVTRILCKDGSYKWIEWTNTPVQEEQLFCVVGRDISERKKTQQEMARLDRLDLIGQMGAGIAHEIRNPMTTIRGYLQLLGAKSELRAYKPTLETMISELDRANSIITEFLSLAKSIPTEQRPQNINDILRKLYPLLEADTFSQNKQIVLETQETPDISMDDKEISQLILNLCRNGLEAMEERGTLTIRTYTDDEDVVLSIQDEGYGIPSEYFDKLGTPFYTTKENGTGLGLATCYSIANRHNSKIDIESGPNGTIFNVRFPSFVSRETDTNYVC